MYCSAKHGKIPIPNWKKIIFQGWDGIKWDAAVGAGGLTGEGLWAGSLGPGPALSAVRPTGEGLHSCVPTRPVWAWRCHRKGVPDKQPGASPKDTSLGCLGQARRWCMQCDRHICRGVLFEAGKLAGVPIKQWCSLNLKQRSSEIRFLPS